MSKLDELLAGYNSGGKLAPGISLALIKEGKCILKKSYGFGNLENKVKINSKTTFYLASLTKSFTAAGILLLHENGRLDLYDNITKYFTGLPDYCKDIKIINLVFHTSGLKDYFDFYFTNNQNINDITNNDVYGFITKEAALNYPAGDKFEYSNTNYVLLSLLIEKVSGQSLADFLKENFFIPLGMKNTFVFSENKPIIPNRAYGYKKIKDKYYCDNYHILTTGDGGIYSCIDDLIIWTQALDSDGKVFLKKTAETVFPRGQLIKPEPPQIPGIYAFGWLICEISGHNVVWSGGQLAGFTNLIFKLPEDDFSIIILTNCFNEVLDKILRANINFAIETHAEYCNKKS